MELERIKAAVKAGLTVHWASSGYTVETDKYDQWFVTWDKGGRRENSVGLVYGPAMDVFRSYDRAIYQSYKAREGKLVENEQSFYVSWKHMKFGMDDAGQVWPVSREPKNNGKPTRYVSVFNGKEHVWVSVVSYLPEVLVDADMAQDLVTDMLMERGWLTEEMPATVAVI